jgi:hypothetical protein
VPSIVQAGYYNDSGAWTLLTNYSYSFLADTWYTIRIRSKPETGADASDGIVKVWLDGNEVITQSDCNNYTTKDMKTIRLGFQSAVNTNTTYFYDNLRVRADASF